MLQLLFLDPTLQHKTTSRNVPDIDKLNVDEDYEKLNRNLIKNINRSLIINLKKRDHQESQLESQKKSQQKTHKDIRTPRRYVSETRRKRQKMKLISSTLNT